jgi:hypothetical protein
MVIRSTVVCALALASAACGDDGAGTQGPPGGEGPAGPDGPAGPSGNPDDPSIGSVSPAWAWLSRSETVSISGYNTEWDDGTTVDFGPGITVDDVVVASPTSIVATVSVGDGADLGAHDVVVTAGGDALTAGGAFDVREGMRAEFIIGDGSQGSFNLVALELHDPAHNLVGGQFTDPAAFIFSHTLGGAGEEQSPYPTLQLVNLVVYEPHFALAQFWVDPLAPADAPVSVVTTDPIGGTMVSTGRLPVAPKTPVALTIDTPETVDYGDTQLGSHLFEYVNDSGADEVVMLSVTQGSGAQPMVMRYAGNSGRIRDGFFNAIADDTPFAVGVRDGESAFMVAVNPSGGTAFTFDAEVSNATPATFYASQEVDDDACEDAQDTAIDLEPGLEAFVIDQGVLDPSRFAGLTDIGESDWYRFSVSDTAGLSCMPQSNHDVLGVALHAANDCETPVASPLAPGEYLIRVVAVRLVTMRGAERYSLVCSASYL